MYNREKYIGECLDSLLVQTFQSFEVIVIDDCSTDNSVAVVESYVEKFGEERLKLIRLEKNTGHPGEPRNKGIAIAQGEYIYCLDSDDAITATAFEEMYNLGKKFDADVVYCEKYFKSEGTGQEFKANIQVTDNRLQNPPFVKEPTLETDNLEERVKKLLRGNHWMSPALRIVKRDLLIENGITFPLLVGSEDDIWSTEVFFCSKRFLRIPNLCFIRRIHNDGISFGEYTTPDHVQRWMDITIRSLKGLDNFLQRIEFFRENPRYRYAVLNRSVNGSFVNIFERCSSVSPFDIYNIFQEKFGKYLGDHDVLVASLCAYAINHHRDLSNKQNKITKETNQRISEQEEEIKRLKSEIRSLSPLPPLRSIRPAVSVIIPMYNAENYIGECLESILNQTLQNFEVIVVDDCSTDNSVKVVKEYAPKFGDRLTLATMYANSGVGSAPRNKGVKISRGEYLSFMDADDFFSETALEDMYAPAKAFNADVAYTESFFFCENDRTGVRKTQDKLASGEIKLEVNEQLKHLELYAADTYYWGPFSKFLKRDWAIENGIYFPEVSRGEDFLWSLKVFTFSERFLRIPTPGYYVRLSHGSVTRTERSNTELMNFWMSPVVKGLKEIADFMNGEEIFKQNPQLRYAILNFFAEVHIARDYLQLSQEFSPHEVFENFYRGFAKELNGADVLTSYLCAYSNDLLKKLTQSQMHLTELEKEVAALKQGKGGF